MSEHHENTLPKDRAANIKSMLLDLRNKFIQEGKEEMASFIKGEDRQLVEAAVDDSDLSSVDMSEDIRLTKLSQHKVNLDKIDASLRKLEEGTYGICEECGTDISEARLKVIPFSPYCVDCQETIEKLEELEREQSF